MNRYWTRIAVGAVAIFCLGLMGMVAVREGKAQVRGLLSTAARGLPLRLANMGFRLHGRQIGEITGIEVQRQSAADVGSVALKVRLRRLAETPMLTDCLLTADDLDRWKRRHGFRCASPSEMGADLVEVGTVSFEPGEIVRPLYLPGQVIERWRLSGVDNLQASLLTDATGGVTAQGKYGIRGSDTDLKRGSFDLQADADGAVISVRDEQGRPLVNFRADKRGVNLNIRDEHGRSLMKLLADSLGASLKIR
jgi:hypothetical protein